MRKTKIICTIGPAVSTKEGIKSLIDAGMDVCRLNFSHGEYQNHMEIISHVKDLRSQISKPLAILLDTKGPEVRTKNPKELILEDGQQIEMHGSIDQDGIPITPGLVIKDLKVGDKVLFDDGIIEAFVEKKMNDSCMIKILVGGILKPNKSTNFPGVNLNLPHLPKKDKEDIIFGIDQGVDAIAVSFAMSAEHILSIRELLRENSAEHILIFAKIESLEGINNFDEILDTSDGIMVARGDLAVECSYTQVPPMQKMMINKCNTKGKPVIVATQMLESMIQNKTPTRAEVSDVANSVFDGTSCTMLSGETAIGKHSAHATLVMSDIISAAEKESMVNHNVAKEIKNVSSHIAIAAVQIANDTQASVILAFSKSGNTARRISALRPKGDVIVVTPQESTFHQCAFLFGARALRESGDYDYQSFDQFMYKMLQKKWVKFGDLVVITMGVPFGVSYTTNTIHIESVGNAILRGEGMNIDGLPSVQGDIIYFFSRGENRKEDEFKGKIVVMQDLSDRHLQLFIQAAGIVLQNSSYDKKSEKNLKKLFKDHGVPYIKRAVGAMSLLKEGEKIRIEPSIGLAFCHQSLTEEQMRKS